MTRLLTGDALRERAQKLAVSVAGSGSFVNIPDAGTQELPVAEAELQRRVIEAETHLRGQRMWVIALASAIASIMSAAAAWYAVFHAHP